MSFTPIKFKFTPPPTIPSQAVLAPSTNTIGTATPVSNQFGSSIAAQSKAAALVVRLTDLNATAAYLAQALQSLVKTLGVTFDLSANPDLGRALSRIYNTDSPPPAMDMEMYISLLETDINFLRFDLLNPADSTVQIEPTQRADIGLATKTFESTLLASGDFKQTLPVLLRSMAGDQVIFDTWTNALLQYPILSVPQKTPAQIAATASPTIASARDLNGSSVDVSDDLNGVMNGLASLWENSYAGIYKVLASPDPTETDLPSVVAGLASQPTSDLTRIFTMLQNLLAFQHQASLKQSHDSVDNLVLPRLMSDVVGHLTNLDYMSQVAVDPSSNLTGSLGTLMAKLSSINPGSILGVGLTGAVGKAAGGLNTTPLTPAQISALAGLPQGLQILGANIAWSQSEATRQNAAIQESIKRLGIRRLTNQGDQTELLTSMKSVSSQIGIIQSIIQSGANTPSAVGNTTSLNTGIITPSIGLEAFGALVDSLPSESGSSFSLDGDTLVVTPPQIPTAPPNVQALLTRGGISEFTTQQFRTPVNLSV